MGVIGLCPLLYADIEQEGMTDQELVKRSSLPLYNLQDLEPNPDVTVHLQIEMSELGRDQRALKLFWEITW